MCKVGGLAYRTAVLAGALVSLLKALPDQAMKAQLVELAEMCQGDADEILERLEFHDEEPASIRAA